MNRRLSFVAAALLAAAACSQEQPVAVAPPIAPSPTVELAGSEVSAGFARIIWNVKDGTGHRFQIYRRLDSKPWKSMLTLTTDALGRMVLEDPSVQPGQTYSYRVRAIGVTTETYSGEVTIVVPVM